MSKIMTNTELINRMKELLNEPNYYGSGGNNWSSFVNGGWYVDCTCSIKAILWGGRFIPANRGRAHAGCNYGSNGVPDFTPSSCVAWTGATRGNFGNLVPGEILLMTTHGHAGLYIGDGQVIEVTPAWTGGTPGCQISQIGKNGERVKNGKQVLSWEWHGKIPVIDYTSPEPTPTPTPTPTPSDEWPKYYTIQSGDTLSGIAKKYYGDGSATYYNYIAQANGIANPNIINIGKTLVIPEYKGSTPTPQPTPAPTPAPSTGLNVGDTVKIIGYGKASSYGTGNTAGGIGWTRKILRIYEGRDCPYQVGDSSGTTGFYPASSLQKL